MISLLEEEQDHEAIHAVSELLRAEELKGSGPDLLGRIHEQIERKIDLLTKIRGDIAEVETIDMESGDDPQNGERRVEDFFKRIANSEQEEERKTDEDPRDRREKRKAKQAFKLFYR